MQKAEIKQIADYLKDLEEGLYEWDYRGITTQGQLTELYRIIKRLMDATFEKLKPLLATLEYKAHKCKQCIETRTGVRN
jgi:restriction endonuclease S subunit